MLVTLQPLTRCDQDQRGLHPPLAQGVGDAGRNVVLAHTRRNVFKGFRKRFGSVAAQRSVALDLGLQKRVPGEARSPGLRPRRPPPYPPAPCLRPEAPRAARPWRSGLATGSSALRRRGGKASCSSLSLSTSCISTATRCCVTTASATGGSANDTSASPPHKSHARLPSLAMWTALTFPAAIILRKRSSLAFSSPSKRVFCAASAISNLGFYNGCYVLCARDVAVFVEFR